MKTLFFATLTLMLSAVAAMACPNPNTGGIGSYTADANVLNRGISFAVTGGGPSNLAGCPTPSSGETGFFITPPHMELTLDDVARARVFVGTRTTGSCDPVILVRGVAQDWYWNDDANGLDAQVTLQAEEDGTLDIWVGSADGSPCETNVVVRIIRNDRNQNGPSDDDGGGGGGGGHT